MFYYFSHMSLFCYLAPHVLLFYVYTTSLRLGPCTFLKLCFAFVPLDPSPQPFL
uniref:Uncharacterized protein n=1 Tax=Arundo donax TaxID=35708 RepID=A0A0A9C550_ARUDO